MVNRVFDLLGYEFGRLKVIERAEDYISPKGRRGSQWLCLCMCGKEIITRGSDLISEKTRSCGCLQKDSVTKRNKKRLINLVGKKYGLLKVVSLNNKDSQYGAIWNCECDWGGLSIVRGVNLKSGQTKSCGCLSESKECTETKNYDHKEKIHISFDHDLGRNLSGYDLAKYIEKWAFHNLMNRITWEIHSANPVGRKSIEMAMKNADKYWTQHEKENK